MDIHEYQAKRLFAKYGILVPENVVVSSAEEARNRCREVGDGPWVIKAQIYGGARAKSGGLRFADNEGEVADYTSDILSKSLILTYDGVLSKKVEKVLIEPKINYEKEFFLKVEVDQPTCRYKMSVTNPSYVEETEEGEEIVSKTVSVFVDPATGFTKSLASKLSYNAGIEPELLDNANEFFMKAFKLYQETDCLVLDIDPFILTDDESNFMVLDSKMSFDDAAIFRQPELKKFIEESSDLEVYNEHRGFKYRHLDGDIGLFVNGAGLSLATYDAVKRNGGTPANTIDINGNATCDIIATAFTNLLKNENVKVILINIFGGLLKCDIVSEGIIKAMSENSRSLPIVLRMDGTHVALGKKMLKDANITFEVASSIDEAAKLAIEILEGE